MAGRLSGNQQGFRNGRLADSIESASIFDGASEISSKTTLSFDLIIKTGLTFNLIHILIDHSLGATVTIVQGDHEGHPFE